MNAFLNVKNSFQRDEFLLNSSSNRISLLSKQKIVLAVLLAAACVSATPTKGRSKRSFSWLPTFLGGTPAVAVEKGDSTDIAPVIANPIPTGPYPPSIGSIVGSGQLINNQVHYPVWHVHKYQGLRLQPLPISLVQDNVGAVQDTEDDTGATFQGDTNFIQGNAGVVQGNTESVAQNNVDVSNTESRLPPVDPKIESWLTPELIKMAREYGVTDFSKVPSLDEVMNLLGTTTKDETVEAVKEFAATENGRDLIRQYFQGGFGGDNDVAASENVDYETSPEGVEAGEAGDVYQGQGTSEIAQYLLPNYQGQLLRQFAVFGSNQGQTEEQSADESADDVEPTTPASFLGRVTQWTNFLNPFTNREEIPIPPSEGEISEPIVEVADSDVAAGVEQPALQNVQVLKSRGPYVRIKLPYAGFNPTPQYYIDPQYLNYGLLQQQGARIAPIPYAPYAVQKPIEVYQQVAINHVQPTQTVAAPEAVVTPTEVVASPPETVEVQEIPQFTQPALDSVYGVPRVQVLQSPSTDESTTFVQSNAQTPQITQSVQQTVSSANVGQPIDFHTPIYNVAQVQGQQLPSTGVAHEFVQPVSFANQPIQVTEPVEVYQGVQPISTLEVPSNEVQQFQTFVPAAVPFNSATNIGQLPLVNSANYEVFRNAPRIISSYGAPVLPYTYDIQSPNTYYISPQASKAYIHQEYEVRPSASELVEQRVKLNGAIQSDEQNTIEEEEEEEDQEEAVNEKQEEIAARSNGNDEKIAPDTNRNDEKNQSEQSKSIDVTAQQKTENPDANANVNANANANTNANIETEPTVEKPSSTEKPIHRNMRPSLKIIKRPVEQQTVNSHIQRVAKSNHAPGSVHRVDPKEKVSVVYASSGAKQNDNEK